MSLALYDAALLEKLKSWTRDTNLHIYGTEDTTRLFQVIADETNDKPIKLPIICLTRNGGYQILNTNKKPLTFDGYTLDANVDKSLQLNAIPINIQYSIDIYTRYFNEADSYARNLVFNIINYPKLTVTLPYHDYAFEHVANIRLSQDVEDNSGIPERLIKGQFTRLSLLIQMDDAYLWDIRERDNRSIDFTIEYASAVESIDQ